MYHFVNATCLARSIGSQWHSVDLSNILVYDIFTTYSKIYLTLSNDVLTSNVHVDMDVLRAEYSSYNDTLNDLLVELADRTLPTVDSLPSTEVKYAKYSDAFRSEYKVEVTKIGVAVPEGFPASELNDLEITRPKYRTDVTMIHDYCLVSVNGFYHYTDRDDKKSYVYEGARTMRKGKVNHLGILSFLDVGKLTKIRLKKEDIEGQSDTSPLSEKVFFNVDADLENKSYFLVLGGYLVFPDHGVFWRNGENSFALDLNQLPYVERIYESSLYMDLQGLELTEQIISYDGINVAEVFSDKTIKNYLTLSQTYLVVVDSPYMVTNKIHIRHSHLPGMFTTYQDPVYPLLVNYGRAAEYWKVYEDGHWAVSVQDSFLRNYVVSQQPVSFLENITGHLVSSKPFYHSRGYLLEIAGYRHV